MACDPFACDAAVWYEEREGEIVKVQKQRETLPDIRNARNARGGSFVLLTSSTNGCHIPPVKHVVAGSALLLDI